MLVERERIFPAIVALEARNHPLAFGTGTSKALHKLLALLLVDLSANTPKRCATGTGFLRNRKCDTFIECTHGKSTLAPARATCHGEVLHVDTRFRSLFESVDNAAHAPSPCNDGALALVIKLEEHTATAFGSDVIRVKRNLSDIKTVRRVAEASATAHHAAPKTDHGRLRLILRTRVADFHGERTGFALVGHLDGELSAGIAAFNLFRVTRLCTEHELFVHGTDFFATALPIGLRRNARTIKLFERVREFCVVHARRDIANLAFAAVVFNKFIHRGRRRFSSTRTHRRYSRTRFNRRFRNRAAGTMVMYARA